MVGTIVGAIHKAGSMVGAIGVSLESVGPAVLPAPAENVTVTDPEAGVHAACGAAPNGAV